MRIDKKYKKIGVGVSGGVDSMVLLHKLLCQNFNILVINIEHGIRGESSRNDSLFVKDYCAKQNIPFITHSFDAVSLSQKCGISIELAARQGRYDFFEKAIKDFSLDAVALAHHLDDQIETILMRIFRGSGIKGLKGIVDRTNFIHPLLDETKEQIVSYATEYGIKYVVDETNNDSLYTRNFIRNELLPLIKSRYPNVDKAIDKLTLNALEIDDCLNQLSIGAVDTDDGKLVPNKLFDAHPTIIKQSIINLFNQMKIFTDIERINLEDILKLNSLQVGKTINLPHGYLARKSYDGILIFKPKNLPSLCIAFDKEMTIDYCNQRFSFEKVMKIRKGKTFDLNKIPKGAKIRTRQCGDVFKRFHGRTKKLSDYLIDEKIPLNRRDTLLLLAYENTILCILGYEISDLIAVDKTTKEIYECKMEIINA